MNIYHYHPGSGAFVESGIADPDPLDAGNWLIPANATTTPPPSCRVGEWPKFDPESNTWVCLPDHRGELWFNSESKPALITFLGDPTEVGFMKELPPPPVTVQTFRFAVQSLLDAKAQEKQYDNSFTLASYVASTNPIWKEEAEAFVAWRDAVWGYALAELDKVQSGTREIPTLEAFLEELPPFEWPAE